MKTIKISNEHASHQTDPTTCFVLWISLPIDPCCLLYLYKDQHLSNRSLEIYLNDWYYWFLFEKVLEKLRKKEKINGKTNAKSLIYLNLGFRIELTWLKVAIRSTKPSTLLASLLSWSFESINLLNLLATSSTW